jgi:hypothetical protein
MNAVSIIVRGLEIKATGEEFSVERGGPDRDPGRQRLHHWLVHACDVHSLFSLRHSECAPSLGVP